MIDTFKEILTILSIIAIILIIGGIIASPERLRELPQRAFLILHGIGDIIRQGCQTVVRIAYDFMKKGANTVGISGDHWLQRIVGAILLSIATALALFVGFLNIMVSLGAVIGSAKVTILDHLPLSIEEYTAVELIVAGVIFGILLLDDLNITHLAKFYSKEILNPQLRYIFGAIFLVGAIFTVYLFAQSGIIRYEAIHSTAIAQPLSNGYSVGGEIYLPDNLSVPQNSNADHNNTINHDPISEDFKKASRILLWGIPLVCVVSGIFSAVGLIPFIGMAVALPVFLLFTIPAGIGYIISSIYVNIIDLVYNFILVIFNFFIGIGQSIRQYFSRNRNEVSQNSRVNNTASDNTSDVSTENQIADSQEKSDDTDGEQSNTRDDNVWNPLL